MVEQDRWVFFKDIEWDDPKFNQFNVDTRDFHVGYREIKGHPDFNTLKNYPARFFISLEELKESLDRYYDESGGHTGHDWRYFILGDITDWSVKYLRIYRTDLGFLVCDSGSKAIPKETLGQKAYGSIEAFYSDHPELNLTKVVTELDGFRTYSKVEHPSDCEHWSNYPASKPTRAKRRKQARLERKRNNKPPKGIQYINLKFNN